MGYAFAGMALLKEYFHLKLNPIEICKRNINTGEIARHISNNLMI